MPVSKGLWRRTLRDLGALFPGLAPLSLGSNFPRDAVAVRAKEAASEISPLLGHRSCCGLPGPAARPGPAAVVRGSAAAEIARELRGRGE